MKSFFLKILIALALLSNVDALACEMSYEKASLLASTHLGNHSDELSQWFNEASTKLVLERIEDNGFFDSDDMIFYFPLVTIDHEHLRGSVWIEVSCDGRSRARHYIEEI